LVTPSAGSPSAGCPTSNYAAELGKAGGAVINATLRSGNNNLHGSVYEYNRVSALAARNFFAASKAHTVYNQFGFTLGGPIVKNKTFFFGDYQGVRDRRGDLTRPSIPPMHFRTGNFSSALRLPAGSQIIYDPSTGNADG